MVINTYNGETKMNTGSQYPTNSSKHRGNVKNFARNKVCEYLLDGKWVVGSKPCGNKQVMYAVIYFDNLGYETRIIKI
jgi:hypothetical protein